MKRYRWIVIAALALLLTGCQKKSGTPTPVENGMAAIEEENYTQAIQSFESSIAEDTDVLLAYRGIGIARMGTGEYEKAVQAFDQALKLTDDKMLQTRKDLLYYKGAALYRQQDYSGAISMCDEILGIAKEANAYYLRGTCYLELNEEDKAKVNFDMAVGKTPEDYDLYLNIYESYKDKKLSAKGDEYLQKAMEIEADSEEKAYEKARIHFALEDFEAAKEELTPLVESGDGKALLLMGQVYLSMKDPEHSRNMYKQYIEKYGESPKAYNGMVLADLADGDYEAALSHVAAGLALEDERGKQELYFNEIAAYEYQHDFETAKAKASAYVEKYPEDEAGQKEYAFLKSR